MRKWDPLTGVPLFLLHYRGKFDKIKESQQELKEYDMEAIYG